MLRNCFRKAPFLEVFSRRRDLLSTESSSCSRGRLRCARDSHLTRFRQKQCDPRAVRAVRRIGNSSIPKLAEGPGSARPRRPVHNEKGVCRWPREAARRISRRRPHSPLSSPRLESFHPFRGKLLAQRGRRSAAVRVESFSHSHHLISCSARRIAMASYRSTRRSSLERATPCHLTVLPSCSKSNVRILYIPRMAWLLGRSRHDGPSRATRDQRSARRSEPSGRELQLQGGLAAQLRG
jgi:hypothetical protein